MCQRCIEAYLSNLLHEARASLAEQYFLRVTLDPAELCDSPPQGTEIAFSAGNMKRELEYPAPTAAKSRQTAVMLRVCGALVENLRARKISTIRDIFYQDVALFRSQLAVNNTICRLCKLMNVSRRDLNVVPSPNGLIVGDVTVVFDAGLVYEIKRANGPTLIPVVSSIFHISVRETPKYIIVIEKEAVFTQLANRLTDGVVLTGKGFPDHYTRKFLRALVRACPETPLFGLVDSDVHGLLILRCYIAGSEKSIEYQEPLNNMNFLGVYIFDHSQGLTPCTLRDVKLAMSTLRKEWILKSDFAVWKQELQRGLFIGKKAEMNLLDRSHLGRLATFVLNKIDAWHSAQTAPAPSQRARLVSHCGNLSESQSSVLPTSSPPELAVPASRTSTTSATKASPSKTRVSRLAVAKTAAASPRRSTSRTTRKANDKCIICRRVSQGYWVECDACNKWSHLRCIGLSLEEALISECYRCALCELQP